MAKLCGYPDYKAALQSADAILCALDDLYLCEIESYDSDFNLSLVDGKCSEPHGATAGRRLAVSGRGDELKAADALLMLTGTDHDIRRAPPHAQQQTVQQSPSKLGTTQQSRTQFGIQQNSTQTGEMNRNSQHRSVQWRLTQTTKIQQNHSQTRTVQCSSTQTVAVHRNPPKHEITKSNPSQPKSVQSYTTQARPTQQPVSHTLDRQQSLPQPEIVMWNPVEVFVQHGFPHSELRKWRRPKTKNTHGSSQKGATQQTAARTAPTQDKPPQTRVVQRNPTRTPILQQALSPGQQNCPQTEWEDVDVVMVPINEVVQHLAHQEETIPLQVHTYVLSALLQQLYRKVLSQCRNGAARQLMLERNCESHSLCHSGDMSTAIAETNTESKEHRVKIEGAGNTVTFGNPLMGRYNEQSTGVQELEGRYSTENQMKRHDCAFFEAGAALSSTYGATPQNTTRRKLTRSTSTKCNRHTEDMLHLLMVLSAALQLFGDSETRNPMPDIYKCLRANHPPQQRPTAVPTEGVHGKGEGGQQEHQQQQHRHQQKKQRYAVKNKKQEQEKGGDNSIPQNNISHPDKTFPSSGHGDTRASSVTATKESDALQSSFSRKTMPGGARDAELRGRQQCHSFTGKDRNKEEIGDNSVKLELENSYLSTVDCSDEKHIKAEELDKILRAAESTILVCAGCGPKPKKARHHEIVLDSQQAAQKRVIDGKHQENSDMPSPQDHCCDADPGELFLIVPVDERIDELCKMSVETLIEEGVIAVVDRSHQRKSCKHAETTTTPQVPQVNTTGSGVRAQGSYSCTPSSKTTSGCTRPHHTTEPANGQHRESDPLMKQPRLSDAHGPRGSGTVSSSSVGGNPPTEEKKEPVTTDPYEMLMQALERRAVALRKGRYRRRVAEARVQRSGTQNVWNTESQKDTPPVKPATH